jgi:hypothetical protein
MRLGSGHGHVGFVHQGRRRQTAPAIELGDQHRDDLKGPARYNNITDPYINQLKLFDY